MSRNICVYLNFLTEAHREKIQKAAARAGFQVRFFVKGQFEAARDWVQTCEILYSNSPRLLKASPAALRWYCCSSAGVDPYCRDVSLFPTPDCMLTNSNVYGATIAEHVVMVLLMMLRRMPEYEKIMAGRSWSPSDPLSPIRSIRDNTFTILGTGDIGSHVASSLKGLGAAKVTGLCRSGYSSNPVWDEVLPISALDDVLPRTKNLVMALPSTPETVGILSRARIARLPSDAYLVNVGRGTAIDQEALADALNSGALAGAALDVMVPEPLPQDHPLWETKNLILTPHVSGNMTLGYTCDANVDAFCADLENYAAGRPLAGLVDRSRGY
ncbi:Phosphoglycerate dehydrogenase [Oscillibacter sp. PC13]|uniref:D-2-hydroxyacid dehydrogenase n=1 Tax=Oscillibacter sp. PC13 TaxID=1855299 RepID=UPI0008E5EDDB|nr:D-2-hydroxyacid dehydrogenase [Oscillibacter sp. PC13]SFO92601.1 Phosphoglycerate dehydrogenase [Oscillibacter sp. PC13]